MAPAGHGGDPSASAARRLRGRHPAVPDLLRGLPPRAARAARAPAGPRAGVTEPETGGTMAIVRTRRVIDDAGAAAVLAAADQAANEMSARVVIAVVDPWGELIELRRTPGAQIASSRVAVDKARTAANFVRPSREMEEQVTGGRIGALALHAASCP